MNVFEKQPLGINPLWDCLWERCSLFLANKEQRSRLLLCLIIRCSELITAQGVVIDIYNTNIYNTDNYRNNQDYSKHVFKQYATCRALLTTHKDLWIDLVIAVACNICLAFVV